MGLGAALSSKVHSVTGTILLTECTLALALNIVPKESSFFCVRSRASPRFEPSHGAHQQATLVVGGGFGRGPQPPYLQCLQSTQPTTLLVVVNE